MKLKSSDWRWVADWLGTFNFSDEAPRGRARQAALEMLVAETRVRAKSGAHFERVDRARRKAGA